MNEHGSELQALVRAEPSKASASRTTAMSGAGTSSAVQATTQPAVGYGCINAGTNQTAPEDL